MNLRDQSLRKARRTNREVDWSSYKHQRNRVTALVKKCKRNYCRQHLNDSADSPNKFWSTIKKLYPTKNKTPAVSALRINGSLITDKSHIANAFCAYFTDSAAILKAKSIQICDFVWRKFVPERISHAKNRFYFRAVTELEVLKEKLNRRKSTGLDNLPSGLLKDAAPVIVKPLTYIINLSLDTSVVPTKWKLAKLLPVFKSGSTSEIDNFRPISVLPVLSKIMEKIVYNQFIFHLESQNLLFDKQFGFRTNRSTAVTYFTDYIRKQAESGKLTGAIFVDLSKAFDTVSHSGLLNKLPFYGVQNKELDWFTNYLFFRKQVVQFKDKWSDPYPVYAGVPQGSILGPILFLIHLNDAHKILKICKMITYADDMVIFTSSSDTNIIQKIINEDINLLSQWLQDNEMVINLKKGKTEVMLFGTAKRLNLHGKELTISINGIQVSTTTNYNYLGIDLDPTLSYSGYFSRVYKKAAGRVNLLQKIRYLIDMDTAERIYKCMIVPIFTYCGFISLGCSETRKSAIQSSNAELKK